MKNLTHLSVKQQNICNKYVSHMLIRNLFEYYFLDQPDFASFSNIFYSRCFCTYVQF